MTQAELQDLAFTANALAANYIAILVTLISRLFNRCLHGRLKASETAGGARECFVWVYCQPLLVRRNCLLLQAGRTAAGSQASRSTKLLPRSAVDNYHCSCGVLARNLGEPQVHVGCSSP